MSRVGPLRSARIIGNLAFIPLSRGFEATIDIADLHLVDQWNWSALVQSKHVYAMRIETKRSIYMHRIILAAPSDLEVDHKSRDTLDNRRNNLRIATRFENSRNVSVHSDSMTGFKGVSWDKRKRKFYARITAHGQCKFLGYHETAEMAFSAYCSVVDEMHGEFARAV